MGRRPLPTTERVEALMEAQSLIWLAERDMLAAFRAAMLRMHQAELQVREATRLAEFGTKERNDDAG